VDYGTDNSDSRLDLKWVRPFLPAQWSWEVACRIWKLVPVVVGASQPAPKVPAGPVARLSSQVSGEATLPRIYGANWNKQPRVLDRVLEIAVVGNHNRRIHGLCKDIDQKVRGDVYVGTLFRVSCRFRGLFTGLVGMGRGLSV
jgi:hypothetical protein